MEPSSIHLSFFPNWLLNNPLTSDYMIWILYGTIVFLSIIVYKLGFARKLPLLKAMIIYIFLFIGCGMLTLLALQMPIVGALFCAALVLSIYKLRLRAAKRHQQMTK